MKNSYKNKSDINSKNIVLKLQELIEKILNYKSFTDIFKVMIFLLRKYLPKDFSIKIERGKNIFYKIILKINRYFNLRENNKLPI